MIEYMSRRIVYGVLVICVIALLVFVVLRMVPGDVVTLQLMDSGGVSAERADELRAELGIDQPVHVQLFSFLSDLVRGDMGTSFWTNQSVTQMIGERIPITLQLGGMAIIFGVVTGIPMGVIAAVKRGTKIDSVLRVLMVTGLSIPNFWLGLLLLTLLALFVGWGPPVVYRSLGTDPVSNLQQMILPAMALGSSLMASLGRLMRSSMLEVLESNFIRTVRAKGAPEWMVLFKHGLRNSFVTVLTFIGLQVGVILGGTVILESIFALPGMGSMIFEAVNVRDYPVVLACTIVYGALFVLVTLVVDLTYGAIDPRIRHSRS